MKCLKVAGHGGYAASRSTFNGQDLAAGTTCMADVVGTI